MTTSARPASLSGDPTGARAETVIDLGALRHNVARLRELVTGDGQAPALMVVVKADGYGHGMVASARAARQAGAEWIGVATLDEALELRWAGDTGRLLCWLAVPGEDFGRAIAEGIDVSAYSVAQLDEILAACGEDGEPLAETPRVQLKFDTGLSRGGAPRSEWQALVDAAAAAEAAGRVRITGLWSHFACSDEPDHPANAAQEQAFREALALAEVAGLRPEVRHLSNSAGALLRPSARFDLVRFGLASYGLSPAPDVVTASDLGLVPVMTVRARVVLGKDLLPGDGVSYGHTYVAEQPLRVALLPLGYGDGIPRHASNRAEVCLDGHRGRILGRVCMDQVVVEAPGAQPGDRAVFFGPGRDGEPTAQDWAGWCDTISYEIVTRMGGRQRRTWVDEG